MANPTPFDSARTCATASAPAATGLLELPEYLDVAAAAPLASALMDARGKALTIDCANVLRLGAQCAQILVSARSTWAADAVPLSFLGLSERMVGDIVTLGLDGAINPEGSPQ